MMHSLKLVLLLSSAVAAWCGLTPPNPRPLKFELVERTGIEKSFGILVRYHNFAWKVSVVAFWGGFSAEPTAHD